MPMMLQPPYDPNQTQLAAPVDPHDTLTMPISAPPPEVRMAGMAKDAGMPDVPTMAPKVNGPASMDGQRLRAEDKLMADQAKDADPYGSADNHPGFFGKLLHGLGVAGDVIAPHTMSRIPGTKLNRVAEENGLEKQVQDIGKEESAENLQGAQAGNQTAEAGKATEDTNEMPGKAADAHALSGATTANIQSETSDRDATAAQGPSLATAYAHRVNEVIKTGGDPSQDPIVQHLGDAITSIQKQTAPKGAHFIQREIGGKPHTIAVDDATGADIRDEGPTGEKPPTVNVNESHKEDVQQRNTIAKTYQPVMDSAERYNVMAKNYEDAVKNHDQQAMLSLLYNHMGMTMGLQKGARMTKDLIHEAQQSQPWLNGIKAHYDNQGYLSGVVLSPQQMREMVSNARGRYSEDVVKARNTAKYLGASDDGPQRTPNQSVINYYTHLAGGNAAKAKQLAGADGWSVQ